ncbi:sigma-70 family RNA polymerase sigma factor [Rhodohalobacter sp. SW132]|uniref:RNA polymerase sigma factor n=1 Tax=Rhodohalobacter sp. SW132 TaxID=2293433 RepID=UPI000E236A22|nr:sigma-70 family RNA polymerase sigma factor [Rhodohalobacter sp. SW132]REL38892.1 sigma-70 family RNA polymerase sigma factor [Rhodohalobacter sp. SW132]
MDDVLLIKKVQQGDTRAFSELVNRWHERIHRFAYRFFSDEDEANEIAQKTFIKMYQNVNDIDNPEKFGSWMYRVANNLCLDELKRAGRRKATPLEAWVEQSGGLESDTISPAAELDRKELGDILQQALMLLPDEQRTVIILKEYEGLKFREIAEILEEPESTVKSRLYYGLRSTRKILLKWNIQHHFLNND